MIIELSRRFYNFLRDRELSIKSDLERKHLHIDDVYCHRHYHYIIGPGKYIALKLKSIKSLEVHRKPYLGIISSDPEFSHALSVILNDLGVSSINLGHLNIKDINEVEKLCDFLLVLGYNELLEKTNFIFEEELNAVNNGLENIHIRIKKNYLYITCDLNYVRGLIAALYAARPLYLSLFNFLVKTYPILPININLHEGIYPAKLISNHIEISDNLDEINAFIITINDKKYAEIIGSLYNLLTQAPVKK